MYIWEKALVQLLNQSTVSLFTSLLLKELREVFRPVYQDSPGART